MRLRVIEHVPRHAKPAETYREASAPAATARLIAVVGRPDSHPYVAPVLAGLALMCGWTVFHASWSSTNPARLLLVALIGSLLALSALLVLVRAVTSLRLEVRPDRLRASSRVWPLPGRMLELDVPAVARLEVAALSHHVGVDRAASLVARLDDGSVRVLLQPLAWEDASRLRDLAASVLAG